MNRYIAVPIGDAFPAEYIAGQLRDIGAEALIVVAETDEAQQAREVARGLSGLNIVELRIEHGFGLPFPPFPPDGRIPAPGARRRRLDEDVLVLQTSGTTGAPKRVAYTLRKLLRSGAMVGRSLDLSTADLGISVLPFSHVGGIACNLVAPFLAGSPMRFRPAFDPRTFFDDLAGPQGATWCYMVPTQWAQVVSYAAAHPELLRTRPWPRLRAVRSASAELPHDLALALADLFGEDVSVLPTYGMTEAMPIAAPPLPYRLERPGSVGSVLPGVSVEIVSIHGGANFPTLPDGAVGEVCVRGPTVLTRYEDEDSAATEMFTPRGFFRTGDLGSLAGDGSGWLTLKGRLKDTINRGGETLSPLEIEAALNRFPGWPKGHGAVELMAFGRANTLLGEDVALAVAPVSVSVDLADLSAWARRNLPSSFLPQTLIRIPELPRSDGGKLLRSRFARDIDAMLGPVAPGVIQTYALDAACASPTLLAEVSVRQSAAARSLAETEVTLAAVLDEVRSLLRAGADIGADTHLPDAGVNSLAALELALRLNERFNCNLPGWAVSDHPTARALCSSIADMPDAGEGLSPGVGSPPAAIAPTRQSGPEVLRRPLRLLFLHGEGSDVELAALSLKATHWTAQLMDRVEFVFLDAPHICDPKPVFHQAAVSAGLYTKDKYRSWGVGARETLSDSISAVESALDRLAPIDAIGGICDGGLVASLICLERPDLEFFLNMASSPPSRLAADEGRLHELIRTPSLHLISRRDEVHAFEELLEIPSLFESAMVVQHASGHVIPTLTEALRSEICALLDRLNDATTPGDTEARRPRAGGREYTVEVERPQKAQQPSPSRPVHVSAALGSAGRLAEVVRAEMAQILGYSEFSEQDDFFDLGGNSLSAMKLSLAIESRIGIKLPLETFALGRADVGNIAQTLEARFRGEEKVTLVPLNQPASGSAYYAFPTMGGHLSDYLALGESMEGSSELIGVRYRSLLSNDRRSRTTLQEIAHGAAEKIVESGCDDRINLIGFSIAGIFAFAAARELKSRGHQVSLNLIDVEPDFGLGLRSRFVREWRPLKRDLARLLRGGRLQTPSFLTADQRLRRQIWGFQTGPIQIDHSRLFVAKFGSISTQDIEKWDRLLGGRIQTVAIGDGHTGLWSAEVASEIALSLASETTLPSTSWPGLP